MINSASSKKRAARPFTQKTNKRPRFAIVNGTGRSKISSPGFLVSKDGVSWRAVSPPFDRLLYDVVFGGGMFVASAAAGNILTSSDGAIWQVINARTYDWF